MKVTQHNNCIILENVTDFNLRHVFLCGQCFRWDETDENTFIGVAGGRVLKISSSDNNITLFDTKLQEFNEIWLKYFDLTRDYSALKKVIAIDDIMKKATQYGGGIRILNQDIWETVISFIISSSNNIPRIKQIISRLCELYGEKIEYENKTYYTFPSPEAMCGVTEEALAPIRAGYRAKYIVDAVQKVNSGEVDLSKIKTEPLGEAKKMLLSIKGIGSKVADCILLFGAGRLNVFPVDTWIDKAMRGMYPQKCDAFKNIADAGDAIFGEYCGLAQQYIYFYARENKLY